MLTRHLKDADQLDAAIVDYLDGHPPARAQAQAFSTAERGIGRVLDIMRAKTRALAIQPHIKYINDTDAGSGMSKDGKRERTAREYRRFDTSRSYLGYGGGIERPATSKPPQKHE